MNEKLLGIYKAIVTDTSTFEQYGKIRTRISVFNGFYSPSNLYNGYDSEAFQNTIEKDALTYIMMPFGGGNNYGMFKLPQVNSIGLVTFIDGNPSMPIWIGSMSNLLFDSNGNIQEEDFPTDDLDKEYEETVYNFKDSNSFVIKTKTNYIKDFNTPETMDWKQNPVENSVVMNQNIFEMRHRIDSDSYSNIIFSSENKNLELQHINRKDESRRVIDVNGEDVTILSNNGDFNNTIIVSGDNISITSVEKNGDLSSKENGSSIESEIYINPALISINSGPSEISIVRDINPNNNTITIKSDNVIIDSKNISLGTTGYNLIATPNDNIGVTLEDGTVLTTVKNLRV